MTTSSHLSQVELDTIHSLCHEKADFYAEKIVDEFYSSRTKTQHHSSKLTSAYILFFTLAVLIDVMMILSWEKNKVANFYLCAFLLVALILAICATGIYHSRKFENIKQYDIDDGFVPETLQDDTLAVLRHRIELPEAQKESVDNSYQALLYDVTHHSDRKRAHVLARNYILELVQESTRLSTIEDKG